MSDHFDPYHVWLGIPPDETAGGGPNHYRLLGLRLLESDADVISNALDQRLAFLRTFQAGKRAALSQKLLNEVSTAGVVLLNPQKKEQYDRTLREKAGTAPPVLPVARALPEPPLVAPPAPPSTPWTSIPGKPPAASAPDPAVQYGLVPAPAEAVAHAARRSTSVSNRYGASAPVDTGQSSLPLVPIIAGSTALVGFLAVALGGWWLYNNSPLTKNNPPTVPVKRGDKPRVSDLRRYNDPTWLDDPGSGQPIAGLQSTTTAQQPGTIEPGAVTQPSTSVTSSESIPSSVESPPPVTTVSAAIARGQAWLADEPQKMAIRLVGGRWIEFHETAEFWFQLGEASPTEYVLVDGNRRLDVRLRMDEVAIRPHGQDWTPIGPGRWVDVRDLPAFAQRLPGRAPTSPTTPPSGIAATPSAVPSQLGTAGTPSTGRPPFVPPPFVPPPIVPQPGVRPGVPPPTVIASNTAPPVIEPPAAPVAKRPVPEAAELAKRKAEAEAIFKTKQEAATRPTQKAALAREMLVSASTAGSDTTAHYVLIDMAREMFIKAGEVGDSLAAATALEAVYQIPEDELYLATIDKLHSNSNLPPEERAVLARRTIDRAEDSIDAGKFAEADKLSTIAAQSAGKQKDAELRKQIQQRRSQIVRLVGAARLIEPSQQKLQSAPDDPAANLALGRFHALVLEDWETGLTHLTKANDPHYAVAAKLDLAAVSGKPADLAAAGEAWQKLAADTKVVSREDRPPIQRRAKELLTTALGGMSGLDRVRIEKKLAELKEVQAAPAPRAPRSRPTRSVESTGLIGRVSVGLQDKGVVVTYRPGYRITQDDVALLVQAAGVNAGDAWRIDLVGVLSLAVDTRIEVRHVGGSTSGGVHALSIDNQKISEIGDDLSKDDTNTQTLRAGTHLIRWALTGGDLGTASVEFTAVAANGSRAPIETIYFTRDMSAAARQGAVRSEYSFGP